MEEQRKDTAQCSLDMEKRKIVKNIDKLMNSNIHNNWRIPNGQDPIDYYSKLTECMDGLYYIDFSDIYFVSLLSKGNNNENIDWEEAKNLLEKIGGIKLDCWDIIANFSEDPIPFTIIKMLTERIVSFKDLEIHGQNISIKNDDLNSVVEDCGLKSKQKDALQKLNWEVNKKISMIRLEKCSKDIIEYCLKFYIPRNFSDLEIIESPDIKEIDLSMINLKKKRNILLADFPQLESIVFLVETDMECPSLFLECLPKLKKITNFDTFISSGVLLCELHVDWEIFKKIEEMCRRVTKEPLVSSLLEIYCVPYPPEDIDILPHYPWIHVDNLRMHIRIPNSYTSIEDNEKNSYSADVVRNMGINLLD
ncbi:hypothetical protein NEFER01_2243, partial [Nematocida sp. LUAm1]